MTDLDHDDPILHQLRAWADGLADAATPYDTPITSGECGRPSDHGRRWALVGIAAAVTLLGVGAIAIHGSGESHVVGASTLPETTTTTQWFVEDDRVVRNAIGNGSWQNGWLSEDGMTISITFSGAPSYRPGDTCTADYRADVIETDAEVIIRIDSRSPRTPDKDYYCWAIAYPRTVEAHLQAPLGDRTVTALGFPRDISPHSIPRADR